MTRQTQQSTATLRRFLLACLLVAGLCAGAATPATAVCPNPQPPPVAADNDAKIIDVILPEKPPGGLSQQVKVVVENTGTSCWYTDPLSSDSFKIGWSAPNSTTSAGWGSLTDPNDEFADLGPTSVIAPGETAVLSFDILAPDNIGTYDLEVLMYQENAGYFGLDPAERQTVTAEVVCPLVQPAPVAANNDAQILSVNFPETAGGGQQLPATVIVENTGDSCWYTHTDPATTDTFRIGVYGTGSESDIGWGEFGTFASPSVVAPGERANFFVDLTAPSTIGSYKLQVRMNQEGEGYFGGAFPQASNVEEAEVVCPASTTLASENDAEIVSFSFPDEVEAADASATPPIDGEFEVRVTVRNSGTSCWTDDPTEIYTIGGNPDPTNPNNPYEGWQGLPRRALTDLLDPDLLPVKPGEVVELRYLIQAPDIPGVSTNNLQLQMNQLFFGWFGEATPVVPVDVVQTTTPDAVFVESDLPSWVVPNEKYRVRVRMQNTGSQTWTQAGNFFLGTPDGAIGWGVPSWHGVPGDVLPNQLVDFEFDITAPADITDPAVLPLRWKMLQSGGAGWFGGVSPSELPNERDMSNRITVSGDSFMDGTTEYVVRGFNYLPFYDYFGEGVDYTGLPQENAWRRYDEATTRREMRDMASLGANTVRFWAADEYLENLTLPGCTELESALDLAYRHGLRTVLTFPINRDLLVEEFCPDTNDPTRCVNIGRVTKLFNDEPVRDFMIDQHIQVLKDCGLLTPGDRRLFAVEFWQEPHTGSESVRHADDSAKAWHEYVVDKYCDPNNPAGTDCTCDPSDATCDVEAQLQPAFDEWSYDGDIKCGPELAGTTCALNDPTCRRTYLCPPDDEELCTGTSASAWIDMTKEYRRVIDFQAFTAYEDAIDTLRAEEDLAGFASNEDILVTLGFTHLLPRHPRVPVGESIPPGQEELCTGSPGREGRGYDLDPRLGVDLFDYASLHLYPWNDIDVKFDVATVDSDYTSREPEKRYHQLRFALDYVRDGRPVVLEETGYNTCNDSSIPAVNLNGNPVNNPTGVCSDRATAHGDVWNLVAQNAAQIQANGALYWVYSDRADRAQWGAVRLDGTEKPVYADIPGLMEDLSDGRNLSPVPRACLQVKQYRHPSLYDSLMSFYNDYLSAAYDSVADDYGHVEIITGSTCPP